MLLPSEVLQLLQGECPSSALRSAVDGLLDDLACLAPFSSRADEAASDASADAHTLKLILDVDDQTARSVLHHYRSARPEARSPPSLAADATVFYLAQRLALIDVLAELLTINSAPAHRHYHAASATVRRLFGGDMNDAIVARIALLFAKGQPMRQSLSLQGDLAAPSKLFKHLKSSGWSVRSIGQLERVLQTDANSQTTRLLDSLMLAAYCAQPLAVPQILAVLTVLERHGYAAPSPAPAPSPFEARCLLWLASALCLWQDSSATGADLRAMRAFTAATFGACERTSAAALLVCALFLSAAEPSDGPDPLIAQALSADALRTMATLLEQQQRSAGVSLLDATVLLDLCGALIPLCLDDAYASLVDPSALVLLLTASLTHPELSQHFWTQLRAQTDAPLVRLFTVLLMNSSHSPALFLDLVAALVCAEESAVDALKVLFTRIPCMGWEALRGLDLGVLKEADRRAGMGTASGGGTGWVAGLSQWRSARALYELDGDVAGCSVRRSSGPSGGPSGGAEGVAAGADEAGGLLLVRWSDDTCWWTVLMKALAAPLTNEGGDSREGLASALALLRRLTAHASALVMRILLDSFDGVLLQRALAQAKGEAYLPRLLAMELTHRGIRSKPKESFEQMLRGNVPEQVAYALTLRVHGEEARGHDLSSLLLDLLLCSASDARIGSSIHAILSNTLAVSAPWRSSVVACIACPSFLDTAFNMALQCDDAALVIDVATSLLSMLRVVATGAECAVAAALLGWFAALHEHLPERGLPPAAKWSLAALCCDAYSVALARFIQTNAFDAFVAQLAATPKVLLCVLSACVAPMTPMTPIAFRGNELGAGKESMQSFLSPSAPAALDTGRGSQVSYSGLSAVELSALAALSTAATGALGLLVHPSLASTHAALADALLSDCEACSCAYLHALLALLSPLVLARVFRAQSSTISQLLSTVADVCQLLFRHNKQVLESASSHVRELAQSLHSLLSSDAHASVQCAALQLCDSLCVTQPSCFGYLLGVPVHDGLSLSASIEQLMARVDGPPLLARCSQLAASLCLQPEYAAIAQTAANVLSNDQLLARLLSPISDRSSDLSPNTSTNTSASACHTYLSVAHACSLLSLIRVLRPSSVSPDASRRAVKGLFSNDKLLGLLEPCEPLPKYAALEAHVLEVLQSTAVLRSSALRSPSYRPMRGEVYSLQASEALGLDAELVQASNAEWSCSLARLTALCCFEQCVHAHLQTSRPAPAEPLLVPDAIANTAASGAAVEEEELRAAKTAFALALIGKAPAHAPPLSSRELLLTAQQTIRMLSHAVLYAVAVPSSASVESGLAAAVVAVDALLGGIASAPETPPRLPCHASPAAAFCSIRDDSVACLLSSAAALMARPVSVPPAARLSLFSNTLLFLYQKLDLFKSAAPRDCSTLSLALAMATLLLPVDQPYSDESQWSALLHTLNVQHFVRQTLAYLLNKKTARRESYDYSTWSSPQAHSSLYSAAQAEGDEHMAVLVKLVHLTHSLFLLGALSDDVELAAEVLTLVTQSSVLLSWQESLLAQSASKVSAYMGYDAVSGDISPVSLLWTECMSVVSTIAHTSMASSSSGMLTLQRPVARFVATFFPLITLPHQSPVLTRRSLELACSCCGLMDQIHALTISSLILPPALENQYTLLLTKSVQQLSPVLRDTRNSSFVAVSSSESTSKASLHVSMEACVVSILQLAYSFLRNQLPERPLDRNALGRIDEGKSVYFRSAVSRSLCKGVVEAWHTSGSDSRGAYDVRLVDGTKEFGVAEASVAYTCAPRYSLDDFELSSSASLGQQDVPFGTTGQLLSTLRYATSASTEQRLGSETCDAQSLAEQVLAVLVVSVLHLCLGPVDRTALHPLVKDILDVIAVDSSKASWFVSDSWSAMAHWARTLLPLPSEPEPEAEVVAVATAAPRPFRKGGQLRSAITYVTERESID